MTIYSDGAGTFFMGDCVYDINDPLNYPLTAYLETEYDSTNCMTGITDLTTAANLRVNFLVSQVDVSNWRNKGAHSGEGLIIFGSRNEDTINDRYAFQNIFDESIGSGAGAYIYLFNDSGVSNPNNLTGQGIANLGGTATALDYGGQDPGWSASWTDETEPQNEATDIYVTGVCDGESLSLFFYQWNWVFDNGSFTRNLFPRFTFMHAGPVTEVNTNEGGYYSNEIENRSIVIYSDFHFTDLSGNFTRRGVTGVYSGSTPRLGLENAYTYVCTDSQTPVSNWGTGFYAFDDNPIIGDPAIGRIRNVLFSDGFYQIGRPVQLKGSANDGSSVQTWLPVGVFAGRTILMRCFASSIFR